MPHSFQPVVSCIMPTYNRRSFIPATIESFLSQSYARSELLILDDGHDPIVDIVPRDPRIRYFYSSRRLTIGAKRNWGCDLASGDLIAHWDDDDHYPRWRLQSHVAAMSTGADFSGTSCLYYVDRAFGTAFLFDYQGGISWWLAGNSLVYKRQVWLRRPFADIQVREDLRFMWESSDRVFVDIRDPRLCVAAIHADNATPKNTQALYWRRVSIDVTLE